MADDILVLPDAEPGKKSRRIGDVHGGLHAFTEMLADMKKGDRTICVGDLVDRGAANGGDDYGVIAAIIQHKKDIENGADKGEFYSGRGNHEENVINAINAFEMNLHRLLNDDGSLNETAFNNFCKADQSVALVMHKNNGGQWLVDIFKEEVTNKTITVDPDSLMPEYHGESKIKIVRDYMADLPYLVYADKTINGHADIPLSDAELLHKINTGDLSLTPQQKEYVVWSREGDDYTPFVDMGRNRNSILAFVGHNIVQPGADSYTPSVRYNTNTINLDVGAYHYGILFAVDVNNNGELMRFGKLREQIIDKYPHDFYSAEEAMINDHMIDQRLILAMLQETELCDSMSDLDVILNKYTAEFEAFYGDKNYYTPAALMDSVIRHQALSDSFLEDAIFDPSSLERLLVAGFDRRFRFENDMTILDYVKDDPALARVYVQTLLINAIKNGDMVEAQAAIERGASIFCPMANGQTPLELANDDITVIDLILANTNVAEAEDTDELHLNDRFVNTGWTDQHFIAMTNSAESYAKLIDDLDPASPELQQQATIPASCLNKMLYAVTPQEKAGLLEAVLDGFYKKHPVDEEGLVNVSPKDIRGVFNTMDKAEKIIRRQEAQEAKTSKSGIFAQPSRPPQPEQPEQEVTKKETVTLSRVGKRE